MRIRTLLSIISCLSLPALIAAAATELVYENNFQDATVGAVPETVMVLEGGFSVQEHGTNKFLQLPGAPLETYGVIFGPADRENMIASARIYGTNKGRRLPAFAVGLNGVSGYKLQISAAKRAIELYRADELKKAVPYEWSPGQWTDLELKVTKKGSIWRITGHVKSAGGKAITIELDDTDQPPQGRPSIWGNPFSGTPIRFDDLKVWKITD